MRFISKSKTKDFWQLPEIRKFSKLTPLLLFPITTQMVAMDSVKGINFTENKTFLSVEQQKQIKGTVTDTAGNPLPGVNVSVKGTKTFAQTDFNGEFTISAPANATKLVFSFIGMEIQEVAIGNSPLKVILKESGENLDEVVVLGYGTQKKSKLTGSVAKLDHKVLETGTRANPASALAGTVPGLRVQQSSGRPGAVPEIVLRGGTNYDGSGSPLVMVDGFLRSGFSDINQEDIESIEVLKDASATAIYGARASNGVILITTKKGKAGKSNITVNSKLGINKLNIPFDFLNAEDYIYWSRKAIETSGKYDPSRLTQLRTNTPFGTGNLYKDANGNILDGNKTSSAVWSPMFRNSVNEELLSQGWQTMIDPVKTDANGNYDINGTNKEIIFKEFNYKDYALRPQGLTKDFNLAMTGANDKGNYYASLGTYDEQGLPINTFYKRITFVFNGEYKIKPWLTSNSGINFADAKWRDAITNSEANYLTRSLGAPPTMRGTNANGDLLVGRDFSDGNPAVNDDKFIRRNNTDKFTLTQSLKVDFMKNLYLKMNANWFYDLGFYEAFNKDFLRSPGSYDRNRNSSASYNKNLSQTYNGVLNYTADIGKHHISPMIGMEFYNIYRKGLSASGSGAPTDDFMDLTLTNSDKDRRSIDTFHDEQSILSFFSRINYDYDDKYLLTLNIRRDGYSTLLNNRWGNFPGISLGWNMHKEKFFDGISSIINTLKLKASYGRIGNVSGIGSYSLQGSYGSNKYDGSVGYLASGLPFPDLKWEQASSFEYSLDTRLFNKLDLSVAYYNRQTIDKISSFVLPATSGYTSLTTNLGNMQNTGLEVDLNYSAIKTNDFSLNLSANVAINKNKVLKLPYNGLENNRVGGSQINDKNGNLIWVGGLQEGQDPNTAYAYVAEGIIRTQAELDAYALQLKDLIGAKTLVHPDVFNAMSASDKAKHFPIALGDVKWKDVNGDGIINSYDREYMGRTVPNVTGGFRFDTRWKGLSLSARFDYALGHVQYDGPRSWFMSNAQGTFNTIQDAKNTWTPENPNAKFPTYYWADQLYKNNTFRTSSMFYNKADYLAFRDITLAYSLPSEILKKLNIEGVQFSLTGQNLGYLSKSTMYTPERTDNGTSAGGGYPLPRTVIFGIQFTL